MVEAVVLWVLGAVAVAAGAAVFIVDSMARATYALAISFVAVGLMVLSVDLDYIGVVIVLMMVMEMAIMAIYMVMFMGMNPALMPMEMVHNKRGSLLLASLTFVVLAAAVVLIPWPQRLGEPSADPTVALGEAIMGSHMLVMLAISAVLFSTIVAGIVLANPRGRYDRLGADLGRSTPEDPIAGGVGR